MTGVAAPLLSLSGISRSFGATRALRDVSLELRAGEVHGLVGENGAGKSTLLKIVGGIVQPDDGTITIDGEPQSFSGPADAQLAGIQVVHQELALLDELTVWENVFAGRPLRRHGLLDGRAMRRAAREALRELGSRTDVDARVAGLSTADQQFVEIARGLVRSARILVLDEPTAALAPADADRLLAVMRRLAEAGRAIVFVSHRLNEVLESAATVTVLKDGALVRTRSAAGLTDDDLIADMVGRDLSELYPDRPGRHEPAADEVLTIRDLVRPPQVRGVDLSVRRGEIVGIYGLEGAGQDELVACVAGVLAPAGGRIEVAVRPRSVRSRGGKVAGAIGRGIGYVPPDRKQDGLLLDASGIRNVSLSVVRRRFSRYGVVDTATEATVAGETAGRSSVRGVLTRPARTFSGGNQQKLLLARMLAQKAEVLLLNQPTRGVDVGAKAEIYALIRTMCDDGRAAVVVSPEITELLGLCDRVVVIRRGVVSGEIADPGAATENQVLQLAVGATA